MPFTRIREQFSLPGAPAPSIDFVRYDPNPGHTQHTRHTERQRDRGMPPRSPCFAFAAPRSMHNSRAP